MNSKDFKKYIKEKRTKDFIKPYDLAYLSFLELELDKKDSNYFFENASSIVEEMRDKCWNNFLIAEDEFAKSIYKELNHLEDYKDLSVEAAVDQYIEHYVEHFYILSLSNTQSRRSRTGTEFETIVELLFIGANLIIDSQGALSSGIFEKYNLGKAVDLVSPGVLEYDIRKNKCSLISCKTSLRERWSEVIEEKARTGASEVYLATLDEKISKNTFDTLKAENITIVVTKKIKSKFYKDNRNVITFEELLETVREKNDFWKPDKYTEDELTLRLAFIDKQIEKHKLLNHPYIIDFHLKLKKLYIK